MGASTMSNPNREINWRHMELILMLDSEGEDREGKTEAQENF